MKHMYSVHRLIGHWKDRLGYELGHNYVVVGWSVHFVLMRYWVFFVFIFLKNVFYRNIFSIEHFTNLYPYRPASWRQGACRQLAGR